MMSRYFRELNFHPESINSCASTLNQSALQKKVHEGPRNFTSVCCHYAIKCTYDILFRHQPSTAPFAPSVYKGSLSLRLCVVKNLQQLPPQPPQHSATATRNLANNAPHPFTSPIAVLLLLTLSAPAPTSPANAGTRSASPV